MAPLNSTKNWNLPWDLAFFNNYSLLFPYLTLLCSLWRQNLQSLYYRELFGWKQKAQTQRKRSQTLLFLGHRCLIKKKETNSSDKHWTCTFFFKMWCFVCYSTYLAGMSWKIEPKCWDSKKQIGLSWLSKEARLIAP